jgi:hypothetical protein
MKPVLRTTKPMTIPAGGPRQPRPLPHPDTPGFRSSLRVSDRGRVDRLTRTWKTARQKYGKTQLRRFIGYHHLITIGNAAKLIGDFWKLVDQVLKENK